MHIGQLLNTFNISTTAPAAPRGVGDDVLRTGERERSEGGAERCPMRSESRTCTSRTRRGCRPVAARYRVAWRGERHTPELGRIGRAERWVAEASKQPPPPPSDCTIAAHQRHTFARYRRGERTDGTAKNSLHARKIYYYYYYYYYDNV